MNANTEPLDAFPAWKRVQHFWIRHRWADPALGTFVAIAWYLASSDCWFPDAYCELPQVLTGVSSESRRVVYQLVAAAAATMGGFTLTSISILVNLLRTPLSTVDRLLPAKDKARVGSVFLGVLPWLLLLFIASLMCLATDSNVARGYPWLQAATMAVLAAAILSLARVVWVLRRLLSVSTE